MLIHELTMDNTLILCVSCMYGSTDNKVDFDFHTDGLLSAE